LNSPEDGEGGQGATGGNPPEPAPRTEGQRGIWSRQTLLRRQAADGLITGAEGAELFSEKRLDPAGYRLSMGPECYVSPANADAKASVRKLEPGEAFFIPSGQFAFLLTEEVVTVPSDALAFITLRMKVKFRGLVNVSGFHADPGYRGRLVFSVYNAGPADVHLRRGDELFMIMFTDLDRPTDCPRDPDNGFMEIRSSLIAPITGEIQSLTGLKENIEQVEEELEDRLNALEREVAVLRWAVAIFIGGVVALVARAYLGH
jgi:dCTP deaminase